MGGAGRIRPSEAVTSSRSGFVLHRFTMGECVGRTADAFDNWCMARQGAYLASECLFERFGTAIHRRYSHVFAMRAVNAMRRRFNCDDVGRLTIGWRFC